MSQETPPASEGRGLGDYAAVAGAAPGGLLRGVGILFEAMGMLIRRPALWGLASVPLAFSLLCVLGAGTAIYWNAAELMTFLTGWMPELEAGAWYTWIWIMPAKVLLIVFGYFLFILFSAISFVVSILVANVISAPFLDALSRRVELLEAGRVIEGADSGWRMIFTDARATMLNELKRALFFIGIGGSIFLAGVVIPGGQLVAPPLLIAFTAVFLPLDYAGYHFDRRRISFERRRGWVRSHLPTMLGFGGGAFATSLVPVLNFLLLPTLVVAGTLLALRCPLELDGVGEELPD